MKDVIPTSTQLTHQSPSTSTDPPCISNPISMAEYTNVPIAIRKGKRSCTQHPISHFVSFANLSSTYRNLALFLSSTSVPKSSQEALSHPGWKSAMDEEMAALRLNDTWELTDLPAGAQAVGCRWVYAIQYQPDGTIERLKGRVVVDQAQPTRKRGSPKQGPFLRPSRSPWSCAAFDVQNRNEQDRGGIESETFFLFVRQAGRVKVKWLLLKA